MTGERLDVHGANLEARRERTIGDVVERWAHHLERVPDGDEAARREGHPRAGWLQDGRDARRSGPLDRPLRRGDL
ncbi:MAG TPA: hypothetical protein VIK16_03130, partial [Candidatus Limnocylindrales bacterium]